jgi:uncharacterized damage-inducible protein DinB
MFIFDALIQIRQNTLHAVEHLSTTQLNRIPDLHNNNIAWHIGHIMATQQILCYVRAQAKTKLEQDFIEKYRKGTSPLHWEKAVTLNELSTLFIETASCFEKDYTSGLLDRYESYTTSSGITLNTIDDAITYSYGHENLHYGNILTMLKIVQ